MLYVHPDGTREKAHVINVYIHLYNVNRRCRVVIDPANKAKEARAKAEEARVAASLAPPGATIIRRKKEEPKWFFSSAVTCVP